MPIIFVVDAEGTPLLPTCGARARILLNSGRAAMYSVVPFTIRLNRIVDNIVGEFKIGVDDGAKGGIVKSKVEIAGIVTILFSCCVIWLKLDSVNKTNKKLMEETASTNIALSAARTDLAEIAKILTSKQKRVTVTAFHPQSRGINSDKDPNKTATMRKPISGWTIAISDDLFDIGWLNKKLYVDGWGVGKATCRMDKSVKGYRIDVCAPSLKAANKFGIKRNIMVVVLD